MGILGLYHEGGITKTAFMDGKSGQMRKVDSSKALTFSIWPLFPSMTADGCMT